jgi:hypothetical protein
MGLFKTAATVAVASAVHGRVQRRQQDRWAAQDQASAAGAAMPTQAPVAPVAPAQSANMDVRLAQLTQLSDLMKAGVLTEAEFQQQKARILNG